MLKLNKIAGFVLCFAFSACLFMFSPVKAEAYSYTVKISLGNNANAYFDKEIVDELRSDGYTIEYPYIRKTDGKEMTNTLAISGLGYNYKVNFDVDELVKISGDETTGEEKYYVKGIRISGQDALVESDATKSVSLDVIGDETYVVAYGVGKIIPYTVKYQDKSGNALIDDDTLYAVKGEVVFVPAKHVNGYKPDAYFKTDSNGLKEDEVFTFVYDKNPSNTVYDYEYEYESSTTYTTSSRTTHGGTTSTVKNGGTLSAETSETNNNSSAVNNRDEAAEDGADAEGDTIADEDTPADVIDIGEDEVPLDAKDASSNFKRNMIISILIIVLALITLIVTYVVANKKRKQEIVKAKSDNRDNK